MRPARKLLLRDLLIGAGAVVSPGWLLLRGDPPAWVVVPLVVAAVAWAAVLYATERDRLPAWLTALADRPDVVAVAVVGVGLAVLLGLVFVPVLGRVVTAAIAGLGLGHLSYRLVYGVVLPPPDGPVRRVRERSG